MNNFIITIEITPITGMISPPEQIVEKFVSLNGGVGGENHGVCSNR
ncbi:hypothetical protein [Thalassomonas haliotis]|uniref:Uncharacterized protein n=1 Tax=Thalassomonas haliotis TaxID=485448 RepID=A0ABY7VLJ0_9GAMM|nr:hypothetical protein [Thalassomonas haliotis]WDE14143.1 hypothetical protein H3N35_12435 [Thalassomonas haliotis]